MQTATIPIPTGTNGNVFIVFLQGETPMSALVKTLRARASAVKKTVTASSLAEMLGVKHHTVLHAIQRGAIKAKPADFVTLTTGKVRPIDYQITATEARRVILRRAARLAKREAA